MIRAGVNHFTADQVQPRLVLDQGQCRSRDRNRRITDVMQRKDRLLAIQTFAATRQTRGPSCRFTVNCVAFG